MNDCMSPPYNYEQIENIHIYVNNLLDNHQRRYKYTNIQKINLEGYHDVVIKKSISNILVSKMLCHNWMILFVIVNLFKIVYLKGSANREEQRGFPSTGACCK